MAPRLRHRALLQLLAAAFALIAALLATPSALAATIITGGNVINQTWTPAGSPYILQGDVTVPVGAFLTIQPGTAIQVVNGDAIASGLSTTKTEIIVRGTLNAQGTAASPITMQADVGTSAGHWYGIVVDNASAVLNTDSLSIRHASFGVLVTAGTQALNGITAANNTYGVYFGQQGGGAVTNSILRNNNSVGLYVDIGSGTSTVTVDHTTIYGNPSRGVEVYASSGATANVTIKNSVITNNGSYGVYRNVSPGTTNVSVTYSNVWSHGSGNYANFSGGVGTHSANPLYVNAGTGNLRLTSNSPSRFGGDTGQDVGALPYTGDQTPTLQGVLWSSTTLSGSQTVVGDLTVPAGVTLTLSPGATLGVVNGDGMVTGLTTSKTEITIRGTLNAQGGAALPITIKADVGTSAAHWYGLIVDQPSAVLNTDNLLLQHATFGVLVRAGAPALYGVTAANNTYGIYFGEQGGGTVTNSILRNNNSVGLYVDIGSGTSTVTVNHTTIYGNPSRGVEVYASSGATANVTIKNSVITNNGSYGVYRNVGPGTTNVSVTYSNVWSHGSGNYANFSGGVGTHSANPLYVNAATGNLRLTSNSPSRFGGDMGQDIGALPYVSDPTPNLQGVLWTNTTLSGAQTVVGDLTVPAGVTLTLSPGATLGVVNGDGMVTGLTTSKTEITIRGTLNAQGGAGLPITIKADVGTSAAHWYGLIVDQPSAVLSTDNLLLQHATFGVLVRAGAPALHGVTAANNTYGIYFGEQGGGTVTNSILRNNNSVGLYVDIGSGTSTVTVDHTTIYGNPSRGVEVYASSGATANVTIKNSVITNNGSYGVYRNVSPGTTNVSVTYSNVWSHGSGNYANFSGGAGTHSANPLYVNAGAGNLRLTSNSPSRFGGDMGQDIGALPYTGDQTPTLQGVLWSSAVLSGAQTVVGDLTVPPGVTLTLSPGTTLGVVNGDGMVAGLTTSKTEITIRGTLIALGTTASPIDIKADVGTSAAHWYGLIFDTPGAALSSIQLKIQHATFGVLVRAGAPTLNGITAANNTYGVYLGEQGGGTVTNSILRNNSSVGLYVDIGSGTSTVTATNTTIYGNPSRGVEVYASSGATANVTIKNAIITNNGSYGVYRNVGPGTTNVSVTYSDVWTHSSANYANLAAGVGCISQNPLYVAAPLNLELQSMSACIDAGTAMGAPSNDAKGAARPINGDGLNAAEFDMGAYEFVPASFCGDGLLGPGESCDEGVSNGMYGHCKADCSGQGPYCGDSVQNGPEACDDGNQSNTDACLNTCVAATCGDTFVRSGFEQCDDGNQANTDACLNTCQNATCGDGFVRSGFEQCDDTNQSNTDACTNTCQNAACGDGFVQAGVEQCDDINNSNTDACTNTCQNAACGDGFVRVGVEQCDDNNQVNTDACLSTCQTATCGDGFLYAGVEQCDDNNQVNTDACLSTCQTATCGDGFIQMGVEQCDDQNPINTDTCLSTCQAATCGDGFIQAGVEQCDDNNQVNTDTCLSTCQTATCGDGFVLAGVEQCDDKNQVNTDACLTTCQSASCGDGFVQAGVETCDDQNQVNNDACLNSCQTAACGDGVVYAGMETCDDGNMVNGDACLNTCVPAACGDGVVHQGAEECDDGNSTETDACLNACVDATCGDSVVHEGVETCDDGNNVDDDGCSNICALPGCGDGVKQQGEACDDGNSSNEDACLSTCVDAKCGDGFVQDGAEECDDGDADDTDDCLATCAAAACGDGFVQDGIEACDDGNDIDTDACVATCEAAACGDGYLQTGVEQCDDANNVDDDGCSNTCASVSCGDGVVQSSEPCDDGNLSNSDECLNSCHKASCGDGFVHAGAEECDDGNGADGDGCTVECTEETSGAGGAGGNGGGTPEEEGGCGCRVAGAPDNRAGFAAVAVMGLVMALRRRRTPAEQARGR